MGKLSTVRPRIGSVGPRVATLDSVQAKERVDYRHLYATREWRALRAAVLLRDLYTCKMCGRVGGRLVADHTVPHKGDLRLFFDPENIKTLCKAPCHDRHKQQMERAGRFG